MEVRVLDNDDLLLQTILGIIGDVASSDITSGATDLNRPLSSGQQTYDQNAELWPLAQPIPKLEAGIQCSGKCRIYLRRQCSAWEKCCLKASWPPTKHN